MARQRTPNAKARVLGRDLKDPQRYRTRHDPRTEPLGDPPSRLTADETREWRDFARALPWLRRSDRKILAIACRLSVRALHGDELDLPALAELRRTLTAMGATPADRSKVSIPDDDDGDDPAREFVN